MDRLLGMGCCGGVVRVVIRGVIVANELVTDDGVVDWYASDTPPTYCPNAPDPTAVIC